MPALHVLGVSAQAADSMAATAPDRGSWPERRYHVAWQPRQALIAAGGGAGRRSAKNAAAPMIKRAKRIHSARPLHSPEGGMICLLVFHGLQPAGRDGLDPLHCGPAF
jgi:hypothetical protein